MVRIVRTNGKVEDITPPRGRQFSCNELSEFVGGPLEFLITKREVIYFNKMGKILDYPLNGKATIAINLKYPNIEEVFGDVVIIDRR